MLQQLAEEEYDDARDSVAPLEAASASVRIGLPLTPHSPRTSPRGSKTRAATMFKAANSSENPDTTSVSSGTLDSDGRSESGSSSGRSSPATSQSAAASASTLHSVRSSASIQDVLAATLQGPCTVASPSKLVEDRCTSASPQKLEPSRSVSPASVTIDTVDTPREADVEDKNPSARPAAQGRSGSVDSTSSLGSQTTTSPVVRESVVAASQRYAIVSAGAPSDAVARPQPSKGRGGAADSLARTNELLQARVQQLRTDLLAATAQCSLSATDAQPTPTADAAAASAPRGGAGRRSKSVPLRVTTASNASAPKTSVWDTPTGASVATDAAATGEAPAATTAAKKKKSKKSTPNGGKPSKRRSRSVTVVERRGSQALFTCITRQQACCVITPRAHTTYITPNLKQLIGAHGLCFRSAHSGDAVAASSLV